MIQLRVEEFTAFGRHLRNSPIDLLCHGVFDLPYLTKKIFGWSQTYTGPGMVEVFLFLLKNK